MNDLNASAGAAVRTGTVDENNPWLGLASFTEETRAFFYGRDEEIAELARRVQRKLLTLLFGQSGLGKTSILRAGLQRCLIHVVGHAEVGQCLGHIHVFDVRQQARHVGLHGRELLL